MLNEIEVYAYIDERGLLQAEMPVSLPAGEYRVLLSIEATAPQATQQLAFDLPHERAGLWPGSDPQA